MFLAIEIGSTALLLDEDNGMDDPNISTNWFVDPFQARIEDVMVLIALSMPYEICRVDEVNKELATMAPIHLKKVEIMLADYLVVL